jgi:hypothetical protein
MDQVGRPTVFDRKVFDEICRRLAEGQTLREICRDPAMPPRSTVRGWVLEDREGVSAQYARAEALGLEEWNDETLEIADDATNDWVTRTRRDGKEETVFDREHVERSKLRIAQRNWIIARRLKGYSGRESDAKSTDGSISVIGGLPDD